ncbi:MAG TPA: HD domain-containing protein [Methanoregula sp.]|nr:HD domain-containing protein [Methanoregula sp.]
MNRLADFLTVDPAHRLLVIKSAADHASRAHRGQFRKDQKTPYITHPARVAGLVGTFNGSHAAIIAAWLHDVYEDCSPEWLVATDKLIAHLPLPVDDRQEIAGIVEALTKKNTISKKSARLSDSIERILDAPPEATLVKICDRIDNLLDSADRNGGFTKHYLESTDEIIDRLSVRASLYGYDTALGILVQIRNSNLKKL